MKKNTHANSSGRNTGSTSSLPIATYWPAMRMAEIARSAPPIFSVCICARNPANKNNNRANAIATGHAGGTGRR